MAKKKTHLDLAIEEIEKDIAASQSALAKLKEQRERLTRKPSDNTTGVYVTENLLSGSK